MGYDFNAGEVFRVAVQIEENGRKFYEESLKNIDDSEIKALFADLALQEIEHRKLFETLLAELPPESTTPTVWDPENEIDKYLNMMAGNHVFISGADVKTQVDSIKGTADALKLAMEFEKDSIIFFLSIQEAVKGEKDQEFIKSLVKEEQGHLKRLTLELRRISS